MRIRASAPTRIDLAGGTLDLYPLYLLEEGGLTVNCAIDSYCTVTLEQRGDSQIRISSVDLAIEEAYDDIDSISMRGELDIVARAIRFFRPSVGLNVTAENRVEKGSGLGASSALLIATLGALGTLTGSDYTPEQIIDFAADLEAQCIRVPTGKQDYFSAIFGGVSALWFDVGGGRRECLAEDAQDIQELEKRIILSFAGAPRPSGVTNWSMIRNYIEGDQRTLDGMQRIKQIAVEMRNCILQRNWDALASLIAQEWDNRRSLAEGVTNERVESIMRSALDAGALANKLCGAGGGGCMITCVEPAKRSTVEEALSAAGAKILTCRIVAEGLKIDREP